MKSLNMLLLAATAYLFVGCGDNVVEHQNKVYVLGVDGAGSESKNTFAQLVEEFNDLAGFNALRFAHDAAGADSLISLTKNLQATDGKVGWGQWVTQTKDSNSFSGTKIRVERQVDYAMRLEFDEDYVKNRSQSEVGSAEHYELQKLFFHEVGHGLQMPHNPDRTNLMYYEISGQKDFDRFFEDVKAFFKAS